MFSSKTPSAKPRVFVVNSPNRLIDGVPTRIFDMSPATTYGQLVFLFGCGFDAYGVGEVEVSYLREQLADFSDQDYLLPCGDPSLIALTAMLAAESNGGFVRTLKWEKRTHAYYVADLNLRRPMQQRSADVGTVPRPLSSQPQYGPVALMSR